jgi:hypothetical protein
MNDVFDIAVVGSGASGIAAAISAARKGCQTVLLDKHPSVGGTGGLSGLTTLCGLYDDDGNFLNDGFAREFAKAVAETAPVKMGRTWVLPYRPSKFCEAAADFLQSESVQTHWNVPLATAAVENNQMVSLNSFHVGAVIDCSGTAEVARSIGIECLATDETTQAPAVIFSLQNVSRPMLTPASSAQVLLPLARAGFPPLNFQPDLEPHSLTVKFAGTPEQTPQIIDFLRNNIQGFEKCSSPSKHFFPAHRAGRMIIGQYVLSGAEVLAGTKFPDAVAKCAWPIEQWNAGGIARFRYLPPGTHYEIPARSLRSAKIKNLFMGGKIISADVDAIASARVMGCCLATGAAAGILAADYLSSLRKS